MNQRFLRTFVGALIAIALLPIVNRALPAR